MQIRALKSFYGEGKSTDAGDIIDVPHNRGRQLIAKGYAVEVGGEPVVPQAKPEAEGDSDPFVVRQTGGSTGEDKQPSASQEDRPQRKRRSTSPKDDAE